MICVSSRKITKLWESRERTQIEIDEITHIILFIWHTNFTNFPTFRIISSTYTHTRPYLPSPFCNFVSLTIRNTIILNMKLTKIFVASAAFFFAAAASAQTFVGYMAYRSTWSDETGVNSHCGWYTFDLGKNEFTQHTDDDYMIKACKGGTCAEGHLYAMEAATDSWLFPDPRLNIYNAETYRLEKTVTYGRSDRDHATKDFALNPADHNLYAIAQYRDGNTADGGWIQHYDIESGEMTRVAHLPAYQHALAIDADGHFYTLDEGGNLYAITWNTTATKYFQDYGSYPEATMSKVGNTGLRMQNDLTYANSLCFDYRTGHLYWAASVYPEGASGGTDEIVRGIYEIDMNDAHATLVQEFPDNIVITALALPYLGLDAPDDLQDFDVRPAQPGSENIAMAFTTPSVNYGQTPYPAGTQFRVHPILDGRDYYQVMLDAGYIGEGKALSEADFTATAGQTWMGGPFRLSANSYHTLGAYVECLTDGRVSQTAEKRIWVGFDQPTVPANITLTYNRERDEADITWDPVTTGIHGGDIDTKTLRYIVSRRSNNGADETDIAFGITDCKAHDVITTPMSYTRYGVIAITAPAMSDEGRSSYAVIGLPRELPFMSSFSYLGEFHQFITIDANGDGWDEWETPSWYFDEVYGAAFCYLNRYDAQDDWLVTPALQLEPGQQYDIIFQSYGYYGNVPIHLQIGVGPYAEAESLSRTIYDNTYSVAMPQSFPYSPEDVLTECVVFTAEEGEQYIGFHNITEAFDHMSIDNIYIRPHEGGEEEGIRVPLVTPSAASAQSFDLQGRRNAAFSKGLYITNGKKTIR